MVGLLKGILTKTKEVNRNKVKIMKPSIKNLLREADELLRVNGFRRDGNRRGTSSYQQLVFERKIIRIPMGGKSKR